MEPFGGHYVGWRNKRIDALVDAMGGSAWFSGKRVLEIGCGYGDIGMALREIGADVTFAEGRQEHVDVIQSRAPDAVSLVSDAEQGIQIPGHFDLLIHFGLLYHLDNWRRSIVDAGRIADRMALETEVCDSDDPDMEIKVSEHTGRAHGTYDQALHGTGTRPSAAMVERELTRAGFAFSRVTDNRCNYDFHTYDWPVTNTGTWRHGQRRMWFCHRDART